jgi:hypothetical protein
LFDNSPTLGRFSNRRDGPIRFFKKLNAQTCHLAFVILGPLRLVRFLHQDGRSVAFEGTARRLHDFFMEAADNFA